MTNNGKLIVLAAFRRNKEGRLEPGFEPRQVDSAQRAIIDAQLIVGEYDGVIAWERHVDPDLGKYGPPTILFKHGAIPDFE